ncbi:efflux RND transporter periplasmic adaptor subunit [Bdellovibrio bacteriovorus]|uniref:efflux RND transporter periplasmic adaptor subunit n=1 Tax=Bdellovibrio bacteriovorus TaxID=959 RepID=UPI003AA83B4A
MKSSTKKLSWILGSLVVVVAAGFYLWKKEDGGAPAFREIPVTAGDLDVTILSTGTVQPKNRLEIKAPVAGRIEQILAKEGQQIRKGQILAWMSSTERAAMLDAARAQGADEYKKWSELYLATPVIAPIAGTLILKNVEPGQTFTNTDAIFVMSDRLTVKAQVDETDIAQIKLKEKATIVLDAYPQSPLPATVDQIAFDATTVNNVTTYLVDVIPDNTPDFMRSGMTANVTFTIASKKGVLLVPSEALRVSQGRTEVLVKVPGSKPALREVRTGITDGRNTEVVEGLVEGDVVLVTQFKLGEKSSAGSNPFGPPSSPRRGRQ